MNIVIGIDNSQCADQIEDTADVNIESRNKIVQASIQLNEDRGADLRIQSGGVVVAQCNPDFLEVRKMMFRL